MPVDPATIVGEILGEPAALMRNPANADYLCPFMNSTCIKKGHVIALYPVCSVWASIRKPKLICTCPVRFYEADFINDIIRYCWPGPPPNNVRISYEVKMAKFGKVDMVISDVDPISNHIIQFVSVELQAVDFGGTVEPAYSALINNQTLAKRPKADPNWANVRKRLMSQIVNKGFYHIHWNTRMVVVLQTPLYEKIKEYVPFREAANITAESNIIFALYDYKFSDAQARLVLTLDRMVGTSHNDLMMSALYQLVPDREEFCKRIRAQMR